MKMYWATCGLALLAVMLLAACGDDGSADSAACVEAAGAPADRSPEEASIEAARPCLRAGGLGGNEGDFTDPVNCEDLTADDYDGDFCVINNASTYAAGLVILYVADVDSRDKDVWELHIAREEAGWRITEIEEVPGP